MEIWEREATITPSVKSLMPKAVPKGTTRASSTVRAWEVFSTPSWGKEAPPLKTEASNAGEGWKGPRALSAHRAAAPSPRPKSFRPWRGVAFFWKELENREMELIPFRDWIERSFERTPKLASSHKLLCHLFS